MEPLVDTNPSTDLRRLQIGALVVGLLAAVAAIAGLFLGAAPYFFQAYLFAYLFVASLTFGSLAIAMLYYLLGGQWGTVILRVLEAASETSWLVAVLFIPILLGLPDLYPWARPGGLPDIPENQHLILYFKIPFFIFRAGLYFAILIALAFILTRWAHQPKYFVDGSDDRRRLQRISAFGIILYALVTSLASVDWLMSIEPTFYSTIFGFLIISGQVLAGWSLALVVLPLLNRLRTSGPRRSGIEIAAPQLNRDLGALLLSSVMLWAYLFYSQLVIIWAENLPREASWYIARSRGGWVWVGIITFGFQFALPFMVLISLRAKRSAKILAGLAAGILATRLVDSFWMVVPAYRQAFTLHWLDFVIPIALTSLWLAAFIWHLLRTPEPVLRELARSGEVKDSEQQSSQPIR